MLDRISQAITKRCSTRLTLALLLASAGFLWSFGFFDLSPGQSELVNPDGGQGFLDLKLHYTARQALAALESYGAAGRAEYRRFLALDFVFPLAYGFALAFLLTRTARTLFGPDTPWMRANLLPLGGVLADYVENTCVLWMLNTYPEIGTFAGTLGGYATSLKHLMLLISVLCLLIGWSLLLARRLRRVRRR